MVAATRGCQSLIIIVGIMVPGQQGQPDYQSLIKMVGMMVTSKPAQHSEYQINIDRKAVDALLWLTVAQESYYQPSLEPGPVTMVLM